MQVKICPFCKEEKEIGDFNKSRNRSGKQEFSSRCRDCLSKIAREAYYQKNKEKMDVKKPKTAESVRMYHREYVKEKRKNDPIFKLKDLLRNRTRHAFNGMLKSSTTLELLGCEVAMAKDHIESQFSIGMTWANHGINEHNWQIDHIVPLLSAKNEKELKLLCHYSNLQPIWKRDHLAKTKRDIQKYPLRSTI